MSRNPRSVDFIYLSEPEMIEAGVTDIARCVDVMEETLILLDDGNYVMAGQNRNSHGAMLGFPAEPEFAGMPKDGPDRRFMAMPAFLGGRFGTTGVKWYGSNVENKDKGLPRSIHLFVLNDTDTGAPLALMSANLLSAYRTGAVPAVGVKHLANPDSTTLAVIGPGVMARTNTEAIISQRPGITTINLVGRSQRGIDSFTAFAAEKFPNVTVNPCSSIEQACTGADIVLAAATTDAGGVEKFPYFNKKWLKPGALVLSPAAARFDDDFLIHDARLILDARGLYDAWAEEYGPEAYVQLGIPGTYWHSLMSRGEIHEDRLEVIASVAKGKAPGYDPNKVTLYSVGGMPVEDVSWATEIYGNALRKGLGTSLNLWHEPAMA